MLKASQRARLFIGSGFIGIIALAAYGIRQSGKEEAAARPVSAPVLTVQNEQPAAPVTLKPSAAQASTLALRVPAGYRAISLQTTEEIAVAGMVRPGDAVDVQLVLRGDTLARPGDLRASGDQSEARTLLANIPVLAVGTIMESGSGNTADAQSARTVTLALKPSQVTEFTLARSLGSLYLALRNPGDAASPDRNRAVLSDIRDGDTRGIAPQRRFAGAISRSPAMPIQLTVGGESRTIYAGGGVQ